MLNKLKYVVHLRFFKVATICLDDSFAHSWHSLNHLQDLVSWNAFQLTCVPCKKYVCGISFHLNAFEPISCVVTRGGVYRRCRYYGKKSITSRHGQSIWKTSRTLKVQLQKPSSTMMKVALMSTFTGKDDPELPLLQMIS